jgi:uncharacterized protein
MNMGTRFGCLAVALVSVAIVRCGPSLAADTPQPGVARQLDWAELVPVGERAGFKPGPPPPAHDYLDGFGHGRFGARNGDSRPGCKDREVDLNGDCGPASSQTPSGNINQSLDGERVKLQGYIVPVEIGKDGSVTEFFLASYVGACIHVPPPPPNQMVYVKAGKKFAVRSLYDAYSVTGILRTHSRNNGLIAAAYSIEIQGIERIGQ